MLNDTLALVMSNILNAEKKGKNSCLAKPVSKLAKSILDIMKNHGYISDYEIIKDGKGDVFNIKLKGAVNKCGVIKPRFSFKTNELEKFEKRFLIAKDFGFMIVSTPKGLMTHNEAKDKKLGGRLIAYIY